MKTFFGRVDRTKEAMELLEWEKENLSCQKTQSLSFLKNQNMMPIIINLFRWAANQPDDTSKNQNCLAVEILGTKYGFKDEICSSAQRYICYTKATIGFTTPGKHAQSECAFNFGIDESIKTL